MEIKLIDLLNKIADYENLPKKIKFHNNTYELGDNGYSEDYYSKISERWLFFDKWALTNNLDEKVEIIESEELTPLEKITYDEFCEMDNQERFEATIKEYAVINSLIKKIKEMEEGK